MPVQRFSDGTYSFGLDPDVLPEYSKKGAGLSRLTTGLGPMPVNPLLKIQASREMYRDPATGALSTRVPTNVSQLYRPGGLLYKPPA